MTMLDRMRRHKGWLKWLLALVAVALCLYLIPGAFDSPSTAVGATAREVIADVDGVGLTAGDFEARYLRQVQSYRDQFGQGVSDSLLRQLGIEQTILRQMIDEQITVLEAARQGVRVSNEELAQAIMTLPVFQENGQFIGDAAYRRILSVQNPPLTVSQFEESFRRDLLVDKLRSALTSWMAVSDAEVDREFMQRNERVQLQVVALPSDSFRDRVTVDDEDIAAHFEAHQAEYRVGEQRRIAYLLLDQEEARQRVIVTPGEIQREYNNSIQQYFTPEQIRASHILFSTEGKTEDDVRPAAEAALAQIKGGADFAALARKLSDDQGSKENGGDLGLFRRGQMVPEFESAAFALEPGETSELVRSPFGFHIIRVEEKLPEVTRPLDEVRSEIQERIAMQKASDQLFDRAEELGRRITSPATLERAASDAGIPLQQSEFFARDGLVTSLGFAPEVNDTAFRLGDNEVSGPIATSRGLVFIRVAEKRDPYVPMLDDVKDRVREDVVRARAMDISRTRAAEIAGPLARARDFAATAKSLGFEAKDTTLVARGSALPDIGVSAEVDRVAFALPVGGVSEPIVSNDTTVIVRVAEHDEVTPEELAAGRDAFRAELLNERRERFFSAYMNQVRERTPFEVKSDVLRRVIAARGM